MLYESKLERALEVHDRRELIVQVIEDNQLKALHYYTNVLVLILNLALYNVHEIVPYLLRLELTLTNL